MEVHQENPTGFHRPPRSLSFAQNVKMSNHSSIETSLEVMNTSGMSVLLSEHVSRDHLDDASTHCGRMAEDVPDKFCQLPSIIECCHRHRGLSRRDLKLENLLLDSELKVARTGFVGSKLHTFRESPPSAVPRRFLHQKDSLPPTDVWSLGVIWYCSLTAFEPFDGDVFWDFLGVLQ